MALGLGVQNQNDDLEILDMPTINWEEEAAKRTPPKTETRVVRNVPNDGDLEDQKGGHYFCIALGLWRDRTNGRISGKWSDDGTHVGTVRRSWL